MKSKFRSSCWLLDGERPDLALISRTQSEIRSSSKFLDAKHIQMSLIAHRCCADLDLAAGPELPTPG
jgi:hypothetical protein